MGFKLRMLITHAPLPTFAQLFKAAISTPKSDKTLSTRWCKQYDKAYWLSKSAWSFAAIASLRQVIQKKPYTAINIFCPDFFCNMSLSILRSLGVNIVFYPIKSDLFPDEEACINIAQKIRPDLFIHVHYFGIPLKTNWSFDFCKRNNAWLIEDAVHVLYPIKGIGEKGDFVLYSPHKLLPIPDGAVMIIRDGGPNRIVSDCSAINFFEDLVDSLNNSTGLYKNNNLFWLLKRIFQKLGLRLKNKSAFEENLKTSQDIINHPKMSMMSKRFLSILIDSLDIIALYRKKIEKLWYFFLSSYCNMGQLNNINQDGYIPYVACVSFKDEIIAEANYVKWQKLGIPVMTWPDLPPEVIIDKEMHLDAIKLRKTRIYLPVHQSISEHQIEKIMNQLRYR